MGAVDELLTLEADGPSAEALGPCLRCGALSDESEVAGERLDGSAAALDAAPAPRFSVGETGTGGGVGPP